MATSESEDFESADEEFELDKGVSKPTDNQKLECQVDESTELDVKLEEPKSGKSTVSCDIAKDESNVNNIIVSDKNVKSEIKCNEEDSQDKTICTPVDESQNQKSQDLDLEEPPQPPVVAPENPQDSVDNAAIDKEGTDAKKNRRHERQNRKPKESKIGQSGTKKLGTRVSSVAVKNDPDPEPVKSDFTTKDENIAMQKENTPVLSAEFVDSNKDLSNKEEFTSVFDKLAKTSQSPTETVYLML